MKSIGKVLAFVIAWIGIAGSISATAKLSRTAKTVKVVRTTKLVRNINPSVSKVSRSPISTAYKHGQNVLDVYNLVEQGKNYRELKERYSREP